MLHDSDGERRVQVVKSACHLSCSVTVLDDVRDADLVKYLNWFVDLIFEISGVDGSEKGEKKRETEKKMEMKKNRFTIYVYLS